MRMSERWVPVLAAIVGVLGGMGGALIGGWVANAGQEQRFQDERQAAVQDLHREIYADYLASAYSLLLKRQVMADEDVLLADDEALDLIEATVRAQSAVELISGSQVNEAATELTNALSHFGEEVDDEILRGWDVLRADFVEVAQDEINNEG
jgi:hypothetical protein